MRNLMRRSRAGDRAGLPAPRGIGLDSRKESLKPLYLGDTPLSSLVGVVLRPVYIYAGLGNQEAELACL